MAGLSAGQAYVDIVPRVDSKKVTKEGLSVAKTFAAGFAAVKAVDFLKDSVAEAREAREVANLTAAALKSTGGAANVSAEQIADNAEALSLKTGVDDEAIQSGENLLLTFTKVRNEVGEGNDIFDQATRLGLDMATALGTDARSAALQLGKALNDPVKGVTALQRAGVSFTAAQREQIKAMVEAGDVLGAQKIILGELSTQFGGAAEAAADPMKRLSVVAGNLKEQVGSALLPTIDRVADALAGMSPEAQQTAVKMTLMGAATLAAAAGAAKLKTTLTGLTAANVTTIARTGILAAGVALLTKQLSDAAVEAGRFVETIEAGAPDNLTGQIQTLQAELDRQNELAGAGVSLFNTLYLDHGAREAADRAEALGGRIEELKHEQELANIETRKQALALLSSEEAGDAASRAAKNLADRTDRATVATRGWTDEQKDAASAAKDLSEAVDKLRRRQENLYGFTLSLKDATAEWEGSLDDAKAALKTNGGTLDLSTQKGRENHAALADLVKAGQDRVAQILEETGNVKRANRVAEEQRETLRRVAERFGLTDKQADRYIRTLEDVPPNVASKVSLTGAAAARQEAKRLKDALDALDGHDVSARVRLNVIQAVKGFEGMPGVSQNAAGGSVRRGELSLVGEEGPELVRFGAPGTVIPADKTKQLLDRPQQSTTFAVNGPITIVNPDTTPTERSLTAALRRAAFLGGFGGY